jgi:hypothetical protein
VAATSIKIHREEREKKRAPEVILRDGFAFTHHIYVAYVEGLVLRLNKRIVMVYKLFKSVSISLINIFRTHCSQISEGTSRLYGRLKLSSLHLVQTVKFHRCRKEMKMMKIV